MDTDLDARAKRLLDERRGGWQKVADESGISYSWLSKFVNGHIENPGYETLKKLVAYLEGGDAEAAAPTPPNTPTPLAPTAVREEPAPTAS